MPGAKDKDAPLPVVPAWLKRKGDEAIYDDIRSNPACTARARTGSVIAFPVKVGDINEKTVKCNNDLLNLYAWFVKKYPGLYRSVSLHRGVLSDCAKYWKTRPDDEAFDYKKWKPDGKCIKSLVLCLRRLRFRSKNQRDVDDEMFGTPERDEGSEPDDMDDCGEDAEEEAEGQEPADEELEPLPESPGPGFDPEKYAEELSPAGVAEICSSPEVAPASSSHETSGAVDAKDKKAELQERLRDLKQKMALKRQETQVVPPDLLDRAVEKLRALPSSEVQQS
ncbi:unnamed protein product [Symbiodinium sp. CCMP2592]|nr:unnamed protein product [Symbiodinium sp. CCMP2592]